MQAIAFEPVPQTFSLLQHNLRINGVVGMTKAIDAAISDQTGHAEIRIDKNHSGGATLSRGRSLQRADAHVLVRVRLISAEGLDQLLPKVGQTIVVKIDVEGFEPVVVEELLRTNFVDRVSEIFLEINENWVDADALKLRLATAGFSSQRKIGSGRHYDLLAVKPGSLMGVPSEAETPSGWSDS